jgi:AraC-like DNA-binding protein
MTTRPSTQRHREALLRDALRILHAEYGEPLELDDVARRIATSRRHLQRVFSEVYGESFRTVLTHIRLDRAAELLSDPDSVRVRDVARRVGYLEPAQFAKAFRRRHGVVPSEFRAQALSGRLNGAARGPADGA